MSRIGKQPITIPEGVTMSVNNGLVTVKGAKGELHQALHPDVAVTVEGTVVQVSVRYPDDRNDRALWGLSRMLVANMVLGVSQGFSKKLEIHGVGYRVQAQGGVIILHLGFSHPIEFRLPKGIEAKVDKNIVTISGIDKQVVGETAARIRSFRKPEPYKGKGIRYAGEVVRRKAGKVMKGSESS